MSFLGIFVLIVMEYMDVFLYKVHTSLGVSCKEQKWRKVISFDLQGGAKEELSCHENVMRMLLCVSIEAQFGSHHKSIFLIDSIIELYVK